jgi:hypothetical protein
MKREDEDKIYQTGVIIGQLAFTQSFKILFAGVKDPDKSTGTVRCYRYPLTGRSVEGKGQGMCPKFVEY